MDGGVPGIMAEYIKRDTAIRAVMAAKWVDGSDGAMAMEIVAERRQPPMLLQWCMGGGMIPGDIRSRVVPQPSDVPIAAVH